MQIMVSQKEVWLKELELFKDYQKRRRSLEVHHVHTYTSTTYYILLCMHVMKLCGSALTGIAGNKLLK